MTSWKLHYCTNITEPFFTTFSLQRYALLVCVVFFVIFVAVVSLIMLFFLEDLLSSISLKNQLHFCLCFFRFSLKIIEVAKSSGMERMQNIFQLCNPWFSTQILLPDRKTMVILAEQYNIHISCPQALSKEAKQK